MDLNKYAVQPKATSTRGDLSKYAVGNEAPTLDQLFNVQNAYKAEPEKENIIDKAKKRGTQAVDAVFGEQKYVGQPVLGVTGALGGLANDILGAIISPVIDTVVDKTSDIEAVQKFATSKIGSSGIDAGMKGIQKIASGFKSFEESAPGTAQLSKDVFNTATLLPVGATTREAGAIAKDTSALVSRSMSLSESAVQTKLLSMFEKAIKPTAKKTTITATKYNDDVVTALTKIKENSPRLNIEDATGEIVSRSPQSLNELNQAVEQTKKFIFDEYDTLAKTANSKGAVIKTEGIAQQLDTVATNKALELTSPDVIAYAKNWATRLRKMDELDAQTTQEVIKTMNTNLQSFYKNPTYDSASKVAVDAGIANNFRKALDDAIEGATGESYSALKKAYGSLKAIENDVVRATMRDARKNVKGLLDYTDILTGGQMVSGILSLNPAMFTKGAIERGFKEYIKMLNDPNRVIKKIFDVLDTSSTGFTPKSATFKAIQSKYPDGVPVGMSIQDITKTKGYNMANLATEAKKYKSAEEYIKAQQPTKVKLQSATTKADYMGGHEAPMADGNAPIWDLNGKFTDNAIYPDDFYTHGDYYKAGTDYDGEAISIMQSLKNRPNAKVTVYRAIPKDVKDRGLNTGDWITTTRQYAKEHGEDNLGGNYKIVKQEVFARDIFTDGNSIHEFGYDPQPRLKPEETPYELLSKGYKEGKQDLHSGYQSQLTDIWKKANKK